MPSYSKNEVVLISYPFSDASPAKRGLYPIHDSLIIKSIGELGTADAERLKQALREWLDLD